MRAALLLLFFGTVLFAACGGSGGQRDAGRLIITRESGLFEFDLGTKASKLIEPAPPRSLLYDPAVSPAGDRIAYAMQLPTTGEGEAIDVSFDLWVADRDGSNPRVVYQHQTNNESLRYPKWLNEDEILVLIQEARLVDGQNSLTYGVRRVNVQTGARTDMIEGAARFAISPDGRRMIYAELNEQRTGEVLKTVPVSGGDAQVVSPVGADFAYYDFLTYSPDGSKVAFAAAEISNARASTRYVTSRPLAAQPAPAADGVPADIWSIDQDGHAQREVDLKEDSPALAWSGDGQLLYVLSTSGLYEVDRRTGAKTSIGEGVYHGQLTWTASR